MKDLSPIIGRNLAQLRQQKGLSLDKLAELSGVSKAMISQIERGESNPTVNTLWKIAAGIHVSFAKLIADDKPAAKLVRFEQIKPLQGENDGLLLYPLFSFDQDKGFEIFTVILAAQSAHYADPHIEGSEEYVMLIEGNLEIVVGSEIYTLSQGDAILYQSDKPHIYRNTADSTARFQNIIYYP